MVFAALVAAGATGDPSSAGEREYVRVGEPLVHAHRTVPQAEPASADALAQPSPAPDSARATWSVTDAAPAPERPTVDSVERALIEAGFENVTVQTGPGIQVAYENRRYRRSVEALARARTAAEAPIVAGERRLGMIVAALESPEEGSSGSFRIRYPSDSDFPRAPSGRLRSATFARADLDLGALVDYRLGNIYNPLQIRTQLELRLLLNPWPGARTRLGVAIPLSSDLPSNDLTEELNGVRWSQASLDQFGWIPGFALVSGSGGYFGDSRWGVSAGVARPLHGGDWLLDAQVDRTGLLVFADQGTYYSALDRTSGFAGVTYRPPVADVAIKARGGQFLHGDQGAELELRRSFDDVDVAYFLQRTDGLNFYGLRLSVPIPPMKRASGNTLRVQPAPRFGLEFRDQDVTFGTFVSGVASREDYLRQLNRTSLEDGRDRYEATLGRPGPDAAARRGDWVSFTGMTGFIHTPWAGVLADRGIELGYGLVPRQWAYDHRGTSENQVYYTTLGFLPRVETALRWTRMPGYHSFEEIAPDSRIVDVDRMASARVALLLPAPGRPGLSLGVEDIQGQGRFHSAYAVAGLPFALVGWECRVTAGYGFRAFTAARYVLDGAFAAAETAPWHWLRAQMEYDSEKWNAGVGVSPIAGLRVRAALLNLESPSVGVGWSHRL